MTPAELAALLDAVAAHGAPVALLALALVDLARRRPLAAVIGTVLGLIFWPFAASAWPVLATALPRPAAWATAVAGHLCYAVYAWRHARVAVPGARWRRLVVAPAGAVVAATATTALGGWIGGLLRLAGAPPLDTPGAAAIVAVGMLLGIEGARRSRDLIVQRVPLADPAAGPRPLRVAAMTDLHIGQWFDRSTTAARVGRTLGLAPDLVVLPGDFLCEAVPASAWRPALEPLAELAARVPTFAVLGNHDRHAADALRAQLAAWGIRVVEGEVVRLEAGGRAVEVGGVPWTWRRGRRRTHLEGLPWSDDPCVTRLLLVHDPAAWDPGVVPEGTIAVAGHLHGGQVGWSGRRRHWSLLRPLRMRDFGLLALAGRTLYVSRGAGFYGFPVRIGIPNEIALLEVGGGGGGTKAGGAGGRPSLRLP